MPPHFRHRFVDPDSRRLLYASTNSQGWKDVEHSFEKPAGVYRILFLGDSYTWGFVPLEDLYTRRVEELLKGRGHTAVEVISIGLGGWGTGHCLEALSNEGVLYQPDLVVYQFCSNDVHDNVRHTVAPFRYALDDQGRVYRSENPFALPQPKGRDSLKSFLKSSALVSNLFPAEREWHLQHGHFETESMNDYVARDGKRFSFDINRPHKDFEAICRARDIPLVPRHRMYQRFQNDCHLNKVGNEALANDIVDFLDGWKRVP
jgi:hypothetical protein